MLRCGGSRLMYMVACLRSTLALASCPHHAVPVVDLMNLVDASSTQKDITLPDRTKVIVRNSVNVGAITIPQTSELIFDDTPGLVLKTSGIDVHGAIRLGSESCRLTSRGIGIEFVGDKPMPKGISVQPHGSLDVFGQRHSPTWTRLSRTANAGDSIIAVQEAVDWLPGQKIAVITTQHVDDRTQSHQNEERTIKSVSSDGLTVELNVALKYSHYAGSEYAGEIALLSRNVFLQGDVRSEQQKYGGHVLCNVLSTCQVSSVELYRMGQENVMGKYPLHLHLMGDVASRSYFVGCAVHHSYFRAYVLHGTSNSLISKNVAYDIAGSAYYLEDGVEENNLIEYNLAAFVHIINPLSDYNNGYGQEGVTIFNEDSRIIPTDATASGFYCTNAQNRWIGNSASGGFTGFHFPTLPKALGESAISHPDFVPESRELLEFNGNTAHSSGSRWVHGSCAYVGGKLWQENPGSQTYSYITGRVQPARLAGRNIFKNLKVFACNYGVLFWGNHWTAREPQFALEGFHAYDVKRASSQLGKTYISNGRICAHTDNRASDLPAVAEGFELYDTDMQTIIADTIFCNFDRAGDVAIMDMTHSNIFKQQGMFSMRNVTFEYVPEAQRFRHVGRLAFQTYHEDECKGNEPKCPGTAGSSQSSTMIDVDGSSVGWTQGAIMGADDVASETNSKTNAWWHLDDGCEHRVDWGFFVCPVRGERTVVSLYIVTGIHSELPATVTDRWGPEAVHGEMYHFGNIERKIELGLAGSPMITGPCCDIGWYMQLQDNKAASALTFYLDQIPADHGLVLATPYPHGTSFVIQRCVGPCETVSIADTFREFLDSPGNSYFVDSEGRLFLKFVDDTNNEPFDYAGVQQLRNNRRWSKLRYTVSANFGGDGAVQFGLPDPLPYALGRDGDPMVSSSAPTFLGFLAAACAIIRIILTTL